MLREVWGLNGEYCIYYYSMYFRPLLTECTAILSPDDELSPRAVSSRYSLGRYFVNRQANSILSAAKDDAADTQSAVKAYRFLTIAS
jgi:hypothetical protein